MLSKRNQKLKKKNNSLSNNHKLFKLWQKKINSKNKKQQLKRQMLPSRTQLQLRRNWQFKKKKDWKKLNNSKQKGENLLKETKSMSRKKQHFLNGKKKEQKLKKWIKHQLQLLTQLNPMIKTTSIKLSKLRKIIEGAHCKKKTKIGSLPNIE